MTRKKEISHANKSAIAAASKLLSLSLSLSQGRYNQRNDLNHKEGFAELGSFLLFLFLFPFWLLFGRKIAFFFFAPYSPK